MGVIVGMGASAGGLKALETFFRAMPADTGCTFVIVQHLSPDFKSLMEELLARQTTMPIRRVEQDMSLEPDTIFLIPPKMLMTVRQGRFHLTRRDITRVVDLPINVFFASLAAEAGPQAVAIVFSGGGSDGSEGVRAVHRAGGLVIVQRPDTAEFDSMPRSALATRSTDHVLAPQEMPALILQQLEQLKAKTGQRPQAAPVVPEIDGDSEPLRWILTLLHRTYGVDFSQYKSSTIERRIERRREAAKLETLAQYAGYLAERPDELEALHLDLLIGVTEFFRDEQAFATVAEKIIPELLVAGRQDEVRVWSVACSTGEEPYSLAILFDEHIRATGFPGRVSLFATDVHRGSLEFATAGVYEEERLTKLGPERISRYFEEESPGYHKVVSDLRQRVVFAPHNVASDPPFTRIDLISCRNLLIYFDTVTQENVLRRFHHALRDGGFLFLGPSESLGQGIADAFEVVDSKLKLYRKKAGRPSLMNELRPPAAARVLTRPVPLFSAPMTSPASTNRQLLQAYDHILRRHAPDGLLINDSLEILHFFGGAANYLLPLEGRAHENLLHRVDGDFQLALSTLLPRVFKTGVIVTSRGIRIHGPEGDRYLDIVADPIPDERSVVSLVHLSFVNTHPVPVIPPVAEDENDGAFKTDRALRERIADLEIEVQGTKENLQAAIEELQVANEELQTTNEELLSSNEELQSTNEELSAVNEELYTVNAEFDRNNVELKLLNDDLNNLSNSTEVGTVFVDRNLRIRKFNAAIQKIFKLLPQDVGRPIDHIAYHLSGQAQMLRDVRQVLESGEMIEREVRTQDSVWLLKRILPFVTVEGDTEGVVLTFTDISAVKLMQDRLGLAMVSSRLVWWEWDIRSGRVTTHGEDICLLGYAKDNLPVLAEAWMKLTHPDDLRRVHETLHEVFEGRTPNWSCEYRLKDAAGQWQWVLNSGKVVERDADEKPLQMLGTTQDIRERKLADSMLRRDAELLSKLSEAVICFDLNGIITFWNEGATRLFGWTTGEMVQRPYLDRFPLEARELARQRINSILDGKDYREERLDYRKDGSTLWTEAHVSLFRDSEGAPDGIIGIFHDITARRNAAEEHRRLQQQLFHAQKMETIGTLAGGIAHDFNNILAAALGYADLALLEEPGSKQIYDSLDQIKQAVVRAKELVQRLLTFSRFHKPEQKPVNLRTLLQEALKLARATLPATVELKLDLPEKCPLTLADPNQIHQVVLNLLSNAAHAMQQRGQLVLHLGEHDFARPKNTRTGEIPAGHYLGISVRDTGHGMDEQTLLRIFDPFFTTKKPGEGTGLGLSIVHGIIQAHGGGIDVASTPGQGTTFTCYLPVLRVERLEPDGSLAARKQVPHGAGECILVVDDEPAVALVMQHMLKNLNYRALSVHDEDEFFREFEKSPGEYRLIITDQTMPRMTGLDLARKVRAGGHKLPIIIATGFSRELTSEALDELGRISVLAKPCDSAALGELVHRLLQEG